MGIFNKLFAGRPRKPTVTEEINTILGRFTTATIMGVDREDIGRYPPKQYKVMAFHFGAIEYLSNQYGLDETQTLGIFVTFINKYFNMPINETGSISERLQGFHDNPDQRRYLDAGRDVFQRWHEQDERRAPLELGEMLKDG
ncbi:MAG: hypothetical protein OEU91_03255 [Gammaproteobacteria bacterium]|nr:hypothetical protein [Gammaproteobacteria bacterium]